MTTFDPICSATIEQYLTSLRGDFVTEDSADGCVIITPFMRPDGDFIEVVVERLSSGRLHLTDLGDTLGYLFVSGIPIGRRLQDDARRIGGRFGVSIATNELVMEADELGLGEALHSLIQASLSVASLIEKRRPYVNLRFDEEVEAVIIGQGKSYDPDYEVRGVVEPHRIKFHVNSGLNLLIQPLSHASEQTAHESAMKWYYRFDDIQKGDSLWSCIAVLDDRGDRQFAWTEQAAAPIERVAKVIRWSNREELVEILESGLQYIEELPS